MRILALDASTTTIGVCILDCNKDGIVIYKVFYIKPSKKGTIFEKLFSIKKTIIDLLDKYKPDEVALEDIILFMPGKSSARTIISLAIFNRIIGLTIFEHLKKQPILLNVNTIRAALRTDDLKEKIKKDQIPHILKEFYDIIFEYKYKKNGSLAPETFDMADAIAIALACAKRKFNVEIEPKRYK
jgi:Holliday junction resolvasome RuvABC endonuclease subunit